MKRGFTLVEIILSIALITVVGVGSIIGFITYKNYTKEKTLNEMDSEILTALRLYMETNEEIKSKVYEEKEGLAVSLQTLQNEGLIDFGNLDITDEDDYVVAFLTAENDCSDISTLKGWDFQDGKPLYICTNSSGGQNLFQVGGAADNLSQATREPYYFKSINDNNYVKLSGFTESYRILYIDRDDSISIYSSWFQDPSDSKFYYFKSELSSWAQKSYSIGQCGGVTFTYTCTGEKVINIYLGTPSCYGAGNFKGIYSRRINASDIKNSSYCTNDSKIDGLLEDAFSLNGTGQYNLNDTYRVLHLKPCVKITSGTGAGDKPYILENKC